MDHPFAKVLAREFIQQPNRLEVLSKSRVLKFGIGFAEIVTVKSGVAIHPDAEQSVADCAISQDRDSFPRTVRQHILFALALEEIIGRLCGMNGGDEDELV